MPVFSFRSSSRRLATICSVAIALSTFALHPSALVVVPRADNPRPEPRAPFDVDVYEFTHPRFGKVYGVDAYVGDTQMDLHLDTGNERTWVLSTLMPEDEYPGSPRYPVGERRRCPADDIVFADGLNIKGDYMRDEVDVGGLLPRVLFTAVSAITPPDVLITTTTIAGNLGFSYSKFSWIGTAYAKGLINPIFMLDFNKARRPKATLSLDNDDLARDTIKWFPRREANPDLPYYIWSIGVPEDPDDPDSAILAYHIDSGSSSVVQPLNVAEKYFENQNVGEVEKWPVSAGARYIIDCNKQDMPSFELSIGDLKLEIPGASLMGPEITSRPGQCWSLLSGYDASPDPDSPYKSPYYRIGTPFLENHAVYFDLTGEGRVGFELP